MRMTVRSPFYGHPKTGRGCTSPRDFGAYPFVYHDPASSHHIWLRDHCRCPSCFHPITKQRLLNTFEVCSSESNEVHFDPVCAVLQGPAKHQTASCPGFGRGSRCCLWVFVGAALAQCTAHASTHAGPTSSAEFHSSFYPWSWLKAHTYDPPLRSTLGESVFLCPVGRGRLSDGQLRKTLWGGNIAKSPPTVSYTGVMKESDQGLYKWLSNIVRMNIEDGKCTADVA